MVLTSALKILVRKSITKEGYIAIKSYFDPVLEKNRMHCGFMLGNSSQDKATWSLFHTIATM